MPHHEPGGQNIDHCGTLRVLDLLKEHPRRARSDRTGLLIDGGQIYSWIVRRPGVVVTDDGDIFGYAQSEACLLYTSRCV